MPIYEYRCSNCGHQQEFLQKLSDNLHTRCTQCGQETFSKMVTAAGFQLKGSGWYATDFKSGGSKPATKTEGGSEAKDGASKTAAKAESGSDAKDGGKGPAPACGTGACPGCR
jgi:putative FmdB family regulatory protein